MSDGVRYDEGAKVNRACLPGVVAKRLVQATQEINKGKHIRRVEMFKCHVHVDKNYMLH